MQKNISRYLLIQTRFEPNASQNKYGILNQPLTCSVEKIYFLISLKYEDIWTEEG
jgi:hypothetical protein